MIKVRPRSDDLMTELPGLIAVLSIRLGAISCVMYNNTEWRITPDELLSGGRVVQLDGCHGQPPNTVEVLASKGNKLVLLVVPYHIDPDQAHGIVMAAAARDICATPATLLSERKVWSRRDAGREDDAAGAAVAPADVFAERAEATQAPYGPPASAQIRTRPQPKTQVTALHNRRIADSDKSQEKSGQPKTQVTALHNRRMGASRGVV